MVVGKVRTQTTYRMIHLALGVLLVLAGALLVIQPTETVAATAKIHPRVLADTQSGKTAHFLVTLVDQADVSGAAKYQTKAARGAFVVDQLRQTAARSQPAVIGQLEALGASYRAYWIANLIAVEGDRAVVDALARHPGVASIVPDPAVKQALPMPVAERNPAGVSPTAVEWNVTKIRAPEVWAMGHTGEGIVVANQDTGFQWDHPALINTYRGWNGSAADHNYQWWDAIHSDISGNGSNPCGFNLTVPCDDYGHGTHTLGTMVGDDGSGNQVGVAPGATWIACRNMEQGYGRPSTYIECFQFFLAPTDLSGNNPDPTLAADVVSNSWSCPMGPPPGGEDCVVDSFKTIIENMRAAGIMIVVAAGNAGPNCSSIANPPGYLDAATTIGSTDINDVIAGSSGRGPAVTDGSNRIKPDISAPGVNVRSSTRNGSYGASSGTSMATPHVAGAVALLWSARPELRGNIDLTETLLFAGAVPRTTTQNCGTVPGAMVPNNTYGAGRLDVRAALDDEPVPTATLPPSETPEPSATATSEPTGTVAPSPTTNALPWDLNGDGRVDLDDMMEIIEYWHQTPPPGYDFTGDGQINVVDIEIVASHWGEP